MKPETIEGIVILTKMMVNILDIVLEEHPDIVVKAICKTMEEHKEI